MAHYLITGGSGFLGINLVRYLLTKGHKVRCLDLLPFDYPEHELIEHRIGDVRDSEAMRDAAREVDFIVHCAAALPLCEEQEIRSTEVQGTACVLAAAVEAGVRRTVFISSTAVYGVPDHHPLTEDDPRRGVGPYGESKIEAEKLCEAARDRGQVVAIIRPKSFIGPERLGIFALLYDFAADGHHFPVLGNGRQKFQLLDVEDLCQAIVQCTEVDAERANDTFNVGASEYDCPRNDFQAVLDAAGFGRRIVSLPRWPAVMALKVLARLNLSPVYEWVYESADKESWTSIDKAKQQLGFAPQHSNRQALLRNFHWYLEHRDEFSNSSGVTHRVPFRQGMLALVKKVL